MGNDVRWGRRGAELVACALVLCSCAAQDPGSSHSDSADGAGRPLAGVEIRHDYGAVSVEGGFRLPEARDLVDYKLLVPPATVDSANFYPKGWDYAMDEDGEPPAHPHLPAGEMMVFDADVTPMCDGSMVESSDPAVVVRSTTADGETVRDRFTLPADEVNDAWNAYCDVGVGAHTARSHGSEDLAEVTVWYEVTNPGPNDVTVTSKRWSDGEGRWGTASVPVPAGETRTLSVTGLDVCDGAAAKGPLRFGLVVATVPGGEAQPVKSYEGATDRGVCNNLGG